MIPTGRYGRRVSNPVSLFRLGVKHPNHINHEEERKQAYLLQFEDVLVEVILQLLVCIVDTELLKAVGFKVLKAEYIQDTDGQALENETHTTTTTTKTYSMRHM